jgi:hypothetical protein
LSQPNLKQFIKQQAIKGENPDRLKEGLILNGWDRAEVEKVVNEVYGLKKKIKKTGLILVILIILILSLSLILIFRELEGEETPITPQEPKLTDTCRTITNIEQKEECYLNKIKEGYMCENLKEEELFYCNRVLEVFLTEEFY